MNKKSKLALGLLAALLLWGAAERFLVSEKRRVQRRLAAMEKAVEKGDLWRLHDAVAPDYSDERGLDRGSLLAAVRLYRSQHGAPLIHISELNIWVEPTGKRAEAKFIATVISKAESGTRINGERFHLHFRKEKGSWLLTAAEVPKLRFE